MTMPTTNLILLLAVAAWLKPAPVARGSAARGLLRGPGPGDFRFFCPGSGPGAWVPGLSKLVPFLISISRREFITSE